jgi:hypothetical protein
MPPFMTVKRAENRVTEVMMSPEGFLFVVFFGRLNFCLFWGFIVFLKSSI